MKFHLCLKRTNNVHSNHLTPPLPYTTTTTTTTTHKMTSLDLNSPLRWWRFPPMIRHTNTAPQC
ncbi:hypothetical protein E2C01_087031 [Portunus trituberculatus]|uniref:Uncharacterized protein n=1 Tax=Portunus trituberculatus TaxID=210409 RepID=A0A5B7JHZ5_PORTR|nr:hypothetical protein [Portunus trituberculatus]